MNTGYSTESARYAVARLDARFAFIGAGGATRNDAVAALERQAPELPPAGSLDSASDAAWLRAVQYVSQHYYAPGRLRDKEVVARMAAFYSSLVAVAIGALEGAAGRLASDTAQAAGESAAAAFLEDFPDNLFPLVAGDLYSPRDEYWDAVEGAAREYRRALARFEPNRPGVA